MISDENLRHKRKPYLFLNCLGDAAFSEHDRSPSPIPLLAPVMTTIVSDSWHEVLLLASTIQICVAYRRMRAPIVRPALNAVALRAILRSPATNRHFPR